MLQRQKYSLVLTDRETEVINKKLSHKRLTQQDSNYLSRYVRPKLKQIAELDTVWLLNSLEYRQKIHSIETKIKLLMLRNVKHVAAILIYGSAIYNNYKDYNDIDVMVLVKKKSWNKLGEKYMLISNIKKSAKMHGLNIDLKIYPSRDIYYSYPSNIALIYELADYKVIYGMLTLQKRINLDKLDLRMHLDYSYSVILSIEQDGLKECTSRDVYSAIRNLVIIHLILQKKVNNILLNNTMKELIGEDILTNLKNETSLLLYKEIGYKILKRQYKLVSKEVKGMNANIKI